MKHTKTNGARCMVCNRPLSDPVSIIIGMGPNCRMGYKSSGRKEKTGNIFGGSLWEYEVCEGVLCITDLLGATTVTNDMEQVLRQVMALERLTREQLRAMPIIYQDSQGVIDGVLLSEGGTVSFYSINEQEWGRAAEKARRKMKRIQSTKGLAAE